MGRVVFVLEADFLTSDMIYREPLLILRRLVIISKTTRVYDEPFHDGVNIIRGTNSTGKSTIMDFIFLALGGDINQWKPEAERCDYVLAELEINGKIITTRRAVSSQKGRPMEIFWGTLDEAAKKPFDGWRVYQYARSATKESFSQVLFRLLDIPDVPNERAANITIHQLLRLLCVDQLSAVLSLFRDEQFDSALTRQTVADLLLGVYDSQLYLNELTLREQQKLVAAQAVEFESLKRVLNETNQYRELAEVETAIVDAETRLSQVQALIKSASTTYDFNGDETATQLLDQLTQEVKDSRSKKSQLETKVDELNFDIQDSEKFIENLTKRIQALDQASDTETALGSIQIRFCPECLAPLDEASVSDGTCFVCKGPTTNNDRTQRISQMRQELNSQINESKEILSEKKNDFNELRRQLQTAIRKNGNLENQLQNLLTRVQSNRDESLDRLLIEQGSLLSWVEALQKQAIIASKVRDLSVAVSNGRLQLERLRQLIQSARAAQSGRLLQADQAIEDTALFLLRNDLPREDFFRQAQTVKADFERNICSVDGRVSFSASSITYLKSSVHFAIFFASLRLDFFRYPKFITNDNIEDKGMEPIRSQNFQKLIVDLSQRSTVRHQIIFTTSMIAPELEDSAFCVGPAYTPTHKSLRF